MMCGTCKNNETCENKVGKNFYDALSVGMTGSVQNTLDCKDYVSAEDTEFSLFCKFFSVCTKYHLTPEEGVGFIEDMKNEFNEFFGEME